MASANTTYLITGGNRGIGQGLVAAYLSRPNTTVIEGPSSQLIIVKLDSKSESDPAAAVKELESTHGITHLDVVVANAGISTDYSKIATVPPAAFREHVSVNGFGPLYLFQATLPLLQKSKQGKFVGIGSPLGSIGGMEMTPFPMAAYGPSKAVLHWIVRKIHFEHEDLISFVVDPGFVQTDMGIAGAVTSGMKEASVPTKDSVAGIMSALCPFPRHTLRSSFADGVVLQVDGATKEKTSGHFAGWNGEEFPW